MEIKIRYFGQLTEIVGKNEENLSTDSKTFADLKEYLIKIYTDLKNYTFQIAQNNEIIGEKEIINNSQIDIFPPFSGG